MSLKGCCRVLCLLIGLSGVAELWAADRVYIMAGQSNMMGRAKTHYLPPTYRKTPNNVKFFYQGRERKLAQYAYFGPEVSFAHNVARAFPQDQHIIIKHVATGSSVQQWLPGQRLYQALLRQIKFSLKIDNPRIEAVIWMQGENDARTRAKAVQYAPRLTRFINSLRKDLNAANSQFVLGEISPEDKAFPMVEVVQQQQRKVSAQVRNTQLVPTQGLGKIFDHVHFSAPGQMELGRRFAQAYIRRTR